MTVTAVSTYIWTRGIKEPTSDETEKTEMRAILPSGAASAAGPLRRLSFLATVMATYIFP
jgi:hypothetical protein